MPYFRDIFSPSSEYQVDLKNLITIYGSKGYILYLLEYGWQPQTDLIEMVDYTPSYMSATSLQYSTSTLDSKLLMNHLPTGWSQIKTSSGNQKLEVICSEQCSNTVCVNQQKRFDSFKQKL